MALVTKLYLQYDERLMYPILSYIQDTYVLMVLYCSFVCIINSIYHLKLKVRYTHNSELRIMSGANMEM